MAIRHGWIWVPLLVLASTVSTAETTRKAGSSSRTVLTNRHAAIPSTSVQRTTVASVDVVIRTPNMSPRAGASASHGARDARRIRSILLVLHGCQHGGYDWAGPTECTSCRGLPEEMMVARDAVRASMIVVAPSSLNRLMGKCWSPREDGPRLAKMIDAISRDYPNVPWYVFGVSSGGAMALLLPHYVPSITAIVSQVMALPPSALISVVEAVPTYPPTLFLHMARDTRTTHTVQLNKDVLSTQRIPTASITLRPHRVTSLYLTHKLGITPDIADTIVSRLTSAGVVDAHGMLNDDPRRTEWRRALHGIAYLDNDTLVPDESPLSEVLNVAWAAHEIFSDANKEVFEWFAKYGRRS
eukprot:m.9294 g.9294  ORF g.9294 m.9294 type:complete len:356 (+) comp2619_c0_seq1:273-1340(+)